MKISVIIPVFNEEKNILECIESLSEQSKKDVEIIIVDDGSTDHTVSNIQINKYSNIQILRQKHQGPAVARNLGAKHASGNILVFIDADMTFSRDFLKNLVKPIEENKTKGTFSKEEIVSNWGNVWARCWNINENLPSKRRLPKNYSDHQKVFRAILKSEFDRVSGFSKGGYTDDYTLGEKLGYEAEAVDDAIFYHKNPDTLVEVYRQAKWASKRDYKLGFIGRIIALFRVSLPISIFVGIYKSLKFGNLQFIVFKIVYDAGAFIGLFDYWIFGHSAK